MGYILIAFFILCLSTTASYSASSNFFSCNYLAYDSSLSNYFGKNTNKFNIVIEPVLDKQFNITILPPTSSSYTFTTETTTTDYSINIDVIASKKEGKNIHSNLEINRYTLDFIWRDAKKIHTIGFCSLIYSKI